MNSLNKSLFSAMAASLLTFSAQANTVSGSLWRVSEAVSQNAIPSNVPVAPADVQFDVNAPFNFSGDSVAVSTWLASSGAFNVVEYTSGTLTSLMDDGTGTQGTMLRFVGVVSVVT